MLKNFKINPFAKWLFLISFSLGNISLFGFIISNNIGFAIAGLYLLSWGTIINAIAFITLILLGLFNKKIKKESMNSALILLINIPIAILYTWIGLSII